MNTNLARPSHNVYAKIDLQLNYIKVFLRNKYGTIKMSCKYKYLKSQYVKEIVQFSCFSKLYTKSCTELFVYGTSVTCRGAYERLKWHVNFAVLS